MIHESGLRQGKLEKAFGYIFTHLRNVVMQNKYAVVQDAVVRTGL